eukprot:TRINITY_DN76506_c0_g1_i1.p1 TRINITY_DN76506_c0_g1~~TRINITY_DN76506_c0_g1_i1.p1  ORF type:complete len:289 (+),score=50.28 TRINITY_DN76506_c0_g1_i1:222-1088(+)
MYLGADVTKPVVSSVILEVDGNNVMFINFTSKNSASDLLVENGAASVKTMLWHDFWPDVEAHAGMSALVQDFFLKYATQVKDAVAGFDVSQVIFTGVSTGGGLAQLALLAVLAEARRQNLNDNMVAILFSSSMTLALPRERRADNREVICMLRERMVHHLHKDDIGPRFPGCCEVWKQQTKDLGRSGISTATSQAEQRGLEMLRASISSMAEEESFMQAASNYTHFGTVHQNFMRADADGPPAVEAIHSQAYMNYEYEERTGNLDYYLQYVLALKMFPLNAFAAQIRP